MAPLAELQSYSIDFAHAYKHVPILASQLEFATILVAPPDGPVCSATLRTQPFGSRRAPANWARVTQFLKWCLEQLCGIVLAVYVDDCHATEPKTTAGSALDTILQLCEILGLCGTVKNRLPYNPAQPPGGIDFHF